MSHAYSPFYIIAVKGCSFVYLRNCIFCPLSLSVMFIVICHTLNWNKDISNLHIDSPQHLFLNMCYISSCLLCPLFSWEQSNYIPGLLHHQVSSDATSCLKRVNTLDFNYRYMYIQLCVNWPWRDWAKCVDLGNLPLVHKS